MAPCELVGELLAVVQLASLPVAAPAAPRTIGAADDRRREDHAEHDAADDAPAEAATGAVVGRLLDLELAVGVALDDDDALDLHVAAVLDRLEQLVGVPCGVGVVEVGDDEGVGAVADGEHLGAQVGRRRRVVVASSDMRAPSWIGTTTATTILGPTPDGRSQASDGRGYRGGVTHGTRVALALGGGGARGYAHIGVIRELEARGYDIVAVSGTSMGAVIGGLYCAGEARRLHRLGDRPQPARRDPAARPVDQGARHHQGREGHVARPRPARRRAHRGPAHPVHGRRDRPHRAARGVVPGRPGRGRAACLHRHSERHRAGVVDGRLLADGGLLNTLPIAPLTSRADLVIAVSLAGPRLEPAPSRPPSLRPRAGDSAALIPLGLRTFDVVEMALESMQRLITGYRMSGYPPDVLIELPQRRRRHPRLPRAGRADRAGPAAGARGPRRRRERLLPRSRLTWARGPPRDRLADLAPGHRARARPARGRSRAGDPMRRLDAPSTQTRVGGGGDARGGTGRGLYAAWQYIGGLSLGGSSRRMLPACGWRTSR